ncbi:hypothetical protein MHIMP23_15815 [Methylobacterium hispanicum]
MRPMFHLVAAALPGGLLTVGLGWRPLGPGVLALAPFVASLSALAVALVLDRRADPADLCRRA